MMTKSSAKMSEKTALQRVIFFVTIATVVLICLFAQLPSTVHRGPDFLVVTNQQQLEISLEHSKPETPEEQTSMGQGSSGGKNNEKKTQVEVDTSRIVSESEDTSETVPIDGEKSLLKVSTVQKDEAREKSKPNKNAYQNGKSDASLEEKSSETEGVNHLEDVKNDTRTIKEDSSEYDDVKRETFQESDNAQSKTDTSTPTGTTTQTTLKEKELNIDRDTPNKQFQKDQQVKQEIIKSDQKAEALEVERKVSEKNSVESGVQSGKTTSAKSGGIPCDAECQSFRRLMESWPSTRVKGAIYILMKMTNHNVNRLKLALQAMDKFVLRRYHYPIIIFHEEDFLPVVDEIRHMTSTQIFFQQVHFEIPSFLEKPVPEKIPGCNRDISYRHMCRFQCKLVYEQPIMEGLDYLWRMDDDSYILAPLTFDLFQYMENKGIEYGYMVIGNDIEGCVVDLWESVRDYVKDNGISTPFYKKWKYPRYYYNNFEVSKRSVWVSEGYKQYIDFIDHKGGLYYHRWGDAPVKSIAVSLLVPENRTLCFKDLILYNHSIYGLPEGFPNHTSIKS